ncbi:MAG: patatin-like phospholipase family protein [Kiritimatiellales bacterium]
MKLFRRKPKIQRVGLALGGGGARGLAHIQVLESLDELGIRPYRMAGTSIGAVMAALYASGLSGKEMRKLAYQWQTPNPVKRHGLLDRHDLRRWAAMLDPSFDRSGLFKGEKIIHFLSDHIKCTTFEKLKIPLYVTAASYGDASEVVFKSGDLLSAVRASMAIPGVFTPVERDGHLLLDGGVVNPLPYDLLQRECDLVIAVDVGGTRHVDEKHRPAFFDTVISSFEIMEASMIRYRLKANPPDIYLKPNIRNVGLLEFFKADQIFEQSAGIKDELRAKLKMILKM